MPSYTQVPLLSCPGDQASGRCVVKSNGVYQATHSSTPHGRMSFAPVDVWIPGIPLMSLQSSVRASTLATPP